MMTHMDEETKWSKLWNLTLGTDLPILYWSGGQEMPGDFVETTPQDLFGAVIGQLESEELLSPETVQSK
jgi:flagellar biosynthesis GTPase FlhF